MDEYNIWVVGAAFSGGKTDVSSEFLKKGYWIDGHDIQKNEQHTKKVKVGDYLLMKSSFAKGKKSCTRLKGIGEVTKVTKKPEHYHFKVKWLEIENLTNGRYRDFDGIGSYWGTIHKSKDDEMIRFAKEKINKEIKKKSMVIIKELLKSKGQIILQGPPGTSKTYEAKELAEEMTSEGKGEYKTIQFHPAYSYEDFVRGIVAETTENNQVAYKTKDKVLVEYAKKAKAKAKENEDKAYVLIIDEINRANLPAVLGELIYALEYRNKPVKSPYEGEDICIPKNLYIIGTMNTADRSVGHIDYAIRRRFAFVEMLPKKEIIKSELGKKLFGEVEQLFVKNGEKSEYLSPDFRWEDVQIGHTYFMFMSEGDKEDDNEGNAKEELARRLKYEIKPILKEYLKDGVLLDTAKSKIKELTV